MARCKIGNRGADHKHAGTVLCAICYRCHGDGSLDTDVSCTKGSMAEHIVHIDGVTGSSPVATTREPNRKGSARFVYRGDGHREPSPVCFEKAREIVEALFGEDSDKSQIDF